MKRLLIAVLLLIGFGDFCFAANQTGMTSCNDTTPTQVVAGQTGRIALYVKTDTSASACILIGPTTTDLAFQLCAGEGVVVTINPFGSLYCQSASGTQSIYYWNRN